MTIIYSTHVLHPLARRKLAGAGEMRVASALDFGTLARESADADIVIVRANLPEAMFVAERPLKAAIRHGAGLDMVPMEAATAAGVLVANTPGVNAGTVAEHVFFVAMALLRRFRSIDRDLRATGWNAARNHAVSTGELAGRTMGIVGMGNIGTRIATIARNGFGLDVAAAARGNRAMPDGVRGLPLDTLLAEADIVVLACPLTSETRGMIDRRRIALMKPGALIVNVSRGPVIDDPALIEALSEGRIGGAALDVFAEQPLPPDHPYLGFDNVVVTPHMAGVTDESMARMGVGAAEEALRILGGHLPLNFRNPEALDLFRKRFPGAIA